ncbi:MAG: myo-inosose-2 dehydratase [Gammaproteobacteria bacterium]
MNHNIKIGVNPICWTNDDLPQLGGHISLETCLSEAQQIGFAGIELGHRFPREASQLYPLLEQYQLALISGWYSGHLVARSVTEERTALQDQLALLKTMGCDVLIYAETSECIHGQQHVALSHRPEMMVTNWRHYGEKLSELAKHVADAGLRLAVHHHMGTLIQTQGDIEMLVEHTTDDVGLVLDTGHLAYAKGDIQFVLDHLSHRIAHVHCKDVRIEVLQQSLKQNLSFLDAVIAGVFTVPGDGPINFKAVIDKLKSINYTGWVVVEAEQYSDSIPAAVYAKKGYDTLVALIGERD